MLFLRSGLFFVGQVITAPIFTLIALLALPLNPITRNNLISGWARSMLWWLKVTCNIRYEITGLEHIPHSPTIILSKHQSAWETFAFQAIFPTQVYVLKRELLWIQVSFRFIQCLCGNDRNASFKRKTLGISSGFSSHKKRDFFKLLLCAGIPT